MLKSEKLNAHNGYVLSVDFDKDGGKIVSGGEDGTVKAWGEPLVGSNSRRPTYRPHGLFPM